MHVITCCDAWQWSRSKLFQVIKVFNEHLLLFFLVLQSSEAFEQDWLANTNGPSSLSCPSFPAAVQLQRKNPSLQNEQNQSKLQCPAVQNPIALLGASQVALSIWLHPPPFFPEEDTALPMTRRFCKQRGAPSCPSSLSCLSSPMDSETGHCQKVHHKNSTVHDSTTLSRMIYLMLYGTILA